VPQKKPKTTSPQSSSDLIVVENNPRENAGGTVPFMEPFNDFTVNDANQKEMQQSYQQQGWIPMMARRQERLKKIALLDGVNTTPNTSEQAQGIGVPTESLSGNFSEIDSQSVNYDSLLDPRNKRFPKITRQPKYQQDDVEGMKL